MGSIGDHENSIALPGRTPIDAHRAATHDPFRQGPLKVPQDAPIACIERIALITPRYVHDAFNNERCHLEKGSAGKSESPFRNQTRHIGFVDLSNFGVTVALEIAIITGPIGLGSNFAKARAGGPQEMNTAVLGL